MKGDKVVITVVEGDGDEVDISMKFDPSIKNDKDHTPTTVETVAVLILDAIQEGRL